MAAVVAGPAGSTPCAELGFAARQLWWQGVDRSSWYYRIEFEETADAEWSRYRTFLPDHEPSAYPQTQHAPGVYAGAVAEFFSWCERHRLELQAITPTHVAAYIEELMPRDSVPNVKEHLAAIRMLFRLRLVGQVMPSNPAGSVRGPRHLVHRARLRCSVQIRPSAPSNAPRSKARSSLRRTAVPTRPSCMTEPRMTCRDEIERIAI